MTDVTELFGEVVKKASEDLQILYPDGKGEFVTIKNPDLNYIFGNSQYIKDQLDTYTKYTIVQTIAADNILLISYAKQRGTIA